MPRSDAELVDAACAGDVDSFRELFVRHYRTAVGIARSRVFDQHLAEDAAQEAFDIACRRLATLKQPKLFPEWLGTICKRTASKIAKTQKLHLHSDLDQTAASKASSPHSDAAAEVQRAIEQLSPSAREVVLLHYFSGLAYDQIAETLATTPQAVHGRLQRARKILADKLMRNGIGDIGNV